MDGGLGHFRNIQMGNRALYGTVPHKMVDYTLKDYNIAFDTNW